MAIHNEIGAKGEQLAVDHLRQQGYEILATNWRARKFEIDIIAKKENEIVFVEVKTRSSNYFENPEEAVTPAKQKHLVNGANHYLQTYDDEVEARFDVIAVVLSATNPIQHFEAAFYPELD